MSNSPFFSVIIPTCNRPQTLARCLRELEKQKPKENLEFEILVRDDNSDMQTQDLLAQHHPEVIPVQGPRKGSAANRNPVARKDRRTG